MMARIQTTLICLLLPCLLQDSLSRHVPHEGGHALQPRIQRDIKNVDPPVVLQGPMTHGTDVDAILRKHNITLPNGYLGQCTVVNSCEGLKEQLEDTNRQLHEKTSHTIQLEQEVFKLKLTVRQLRVKSATCGRETSDHIAKLQAQLEDKMSQLEQMSHDNGNLVLRITALTYEVNELQKKNTSTSTSTKITDLLSQLEEKKKQLQFKTEQLEKNSHSSQRILEIIELQTQIWELEKTNHSQETLTQITVLQRQLDAKINELESNSEGSNDSKIVVMMITLENEITELQKRISELTEESETKMTDLQRQLKEMKQQLIDKILQLPDNNTNTELTEEILALQNAINNLYIQISNLQKKTNAQHAELQKNLNNKEKQQEAWKKQLKGEDETSVQLIMKIIYIMREQRDLQIQTTQQMQTTAAQITALLQQVQDKEDEIDRVQAENKDLQKQLKENNATCFSLENKYDRVRGELEDKINLLNSQNSGISKLVLSIVALNDEVKWLRTQIISPEAADKIDELQKQLEQKNRELKTKSNELQEKSSNGQRILRIIEVQNLIWEFQKGVDTQSNIYQIAVLQKELNDLTAEMEDKADDDSKLVLTITTLQSEVVNLQRMLSALSQSTAAQIVRLEKQLEDKKKQLAKLVEQSGKGPKMSNLENQISEIEKRIAELKEENPEAKITELTTQLKESKRQLEENIKRLEKKDSKNSYLIMQILHLQRKLRDIQNAASQQFNETAADVTALQEQLEAREEESARCQAQNKDLEKRLGDKDAQCSGLQGRYDNLQDKLGSAMNKLDNVTGYNDKLVLEVWTLTNEVDDLKTRTVTSATKINELQKLLDEKIKELAKKTQELEDNAPQPENVLRIIAIQNEILNLQKGVSNGTNFDQIAALENELDALIATIEEKNNGNCKQILQIIALQNQVTRLQRQELELNQSSEAKIAELENQLQETRDQLNEKRDELKETDSRIPQLIAEIMGLRNKLTELERTLSELKRTSADKMEDLQSLLKQKSKQLEENTTQLRAVDAKNAEQILKIIELQKQMNEIQIEASKGKDETASEISALQEQLEAREEESARCQAQNKDLEKRLGDKDAQCSGLQGRYDNLQDKLGSAMNKLDNVTGYNDKLVLEVWTLTNEVDDLKKRTVTSATKINELQKLLDEKIKELAKKTQELEDNAPQPENVLRIIAIQNEILNLQKGVSNGTNFDQIAALENELDALIATIEEKNNGNCKQILQIIALQNQVTRLQRQELELNQSSEAKIAELKNQLQETRDQLNEKRDELKETDSRIPQLIAEIMGLRNKLTELERTLSELKRTSADKMEDLQSLLKQKSKQLEENTTQLRAVDAKNAEQILKIIELQKQMNEIQIEASKGKDETASEISALQEQLEAREEESARCQAQNKDLEKRLGDKDAQRSGLQGRYDNLQDKLGSAMNKLDNVTGYNDKLVLEVWTLTNEVDDLKKRTVTSATKINELQKLLDEKIKELAKKTQELEDNAPQPENVLRIIAIQNEILNLQKGVSNGTNFDQIAALENELDALIATIEEKNNGNCKQILQIIALQNQVTRLQRQELELNQSSEAKIAELENQLQETRDQLNEKRDELKETDSRIPQLIAEIMGLRNKLTELERTLSELKRTSADKMEDLQSLLKQKSKQLEENTTQLRAVDAKNAEQILKIIELQKQMKAIQTEASKAKDKSASEISELQEQLKAKEKLNARLDSKNRELEKLQKETKMECDEIKHRCKEVQLQTDQNQEDLRKMQQQLREKEAAFNRLQQQLRDSKDDNARLQERNKSLQEENDKLKMNLEDLVVDPETVVHRTKVAFDPDTAHPKIILSTDETVMSVAQQRQNVPNDPGRYDLSLAALGKTGFNRGRNYWEVEVAGKTCYNIGVARGSANRKGQLKLKPAEGYWTIILTKQGVLKALAARPLDIQLPAVPQKLGILLDYKKGEVSFYNADTRSLLHTFTGNRFTDKLYPFFNSCLETNDEDAPIVLTRVGSVSWID
ncbi:putative leucine-rich repeat-containing protein DDB_G0290503 isoform X26 [Oncorhynchus keta]|uniref:putative leucine-rich repeat-containing protein DDB_G0290503 isoform X3 n=1 Tax=Oncorhynchus keta TaxID=8018 RepID=UPI00227AB309|nr:putative leucine-rich repeat-containing protein DDB_G0290503 isoform X3 [Oncorhynchus keta]XP_052332545.1 putative leucine-rich repeat-containing protein DDB_G0290503 isoform X4 [Oncorhynchus keta]XP_052332546.1 putative leucine-rich repeat-containing protein DDB_G0290503 isoform X5 [Oncorhynchus keta]XP_052332547.1 putative leucine-rich repeat-containing protein DDB_G0290503 isoform X6 [Oncorhynchus keta]XP_052332548.1 putative leucine-rich repeat-containing protein DDB_G0290503 isoform X7 